MSKKDSAEIRSVSVYQDAQRSGYTTAGAFTHFDNMRRDGVSQIRLDSVTTSRLIRVIDRGEKQKHIQTKLGVGLIFCEIEFAGRDTMNRTVISSISDVYHWLGKLKSKKAYVIDLTSNLQYAITNENDLKWLADFRERFKKQ